MASPKKEINRNRYRFSMDGDTAYLRDLVQLKEKYGAIIIVDEAHASGIYGIGGAGLSHIEKIFLKKLIYIWGRLARL